MAAMTLKLADYPTIAVRYDETQLPFFRIGVEEALAKIKSVPLGQQLLKLIADATPHFKTSEDGTAFPAGIHAIIVPQGNRRFMQSGYRPDFAPGDVEVRTGMKKAMTMKVAGQWIPDENYIVAGHDFNYIGDGSCNASTNKSHSTNGKGSVCEVAFDSAQMMTRKGFHTTPFLVLAHELIHSYHGLYGINKGAQEERWTTGIGEFKDEPMSENGFRDAFNMARRTSY